ncbi:hypothetical protein Ciccas_005628 [Cichlidogyrus casuarinus]|uniref:Uncharacterized protein n=1 Tax=Cichlidogyrus casuarinus TaxID=1844966 RepID=A0ABD2Q860_9PLAT
MLPFRVPVDAKLRSLEVLFDDSFPGAENIRGSGHYCARVAPNNLLCLFTDKALLAMSKAEHVNAKAATKTEEKSIKQEDPVLTTLKSLLKKSTTQDKEATAMPPVMQYRNWPESSAVATSAEDDDPAIVHILKKPNDQSKSKPVRCRGQSKVKSDREEPPQLMNLNIPQPPSYWLENSPKKNKKELVASPRPAAPAQRLLLPAQQPQNFLQTQQILT